MTEAAPRATETGTPLATRLSSALPDLLFIALAAFNSVRIFRHPMWSDEMQDFLLAAGSSSPLDLFLKLKYEGHAGLWHLLLWVVTRFTTDPVWMQALHLAIALGIWVLIWRLAPFGKLEKLLLLLSYFLFFEYFVVSRTYAIGVLLGFAVVVLRMQRPDLRIWPGLLLGLLANTSIFGAIWALGMALFMGLENRGQWRSRLPGTALFVALMAFAIWTMAPSLDNQFVRYAPSLKSVSLEEPLRFAVGAFLPLYWPFTFITLKSLGGWAADLAGTPFGHHPFQSAVQAIEGAGLVPVLLVLALPVLTVWSIVRERMPTLEFATIYAGILLFAQLSQYPFTPRHFGFVFVAFVGVVWMARRKRQPPGPRSRFGCRCFRSMPPAVLPPWPTPVGRSRRAATSPTGSNATSSRARWSWRSPTMPRRPSPVIGGARSITSTASAMGLMSSGSAHGERMH